MSINIGIGFVEAERAQVAALFWEAFGAKLGKLLRPEAKALAFVDSVLDPEFALTARDMDGTLLGVAGFKTADGGLVGGELSDLAAVFGWFGGLWRGLLLSVLERDQKAGEFLMDGIFVTEAARGRGVGTALLEAVIAEARRRDCDAVRLDVIDSNPRAKALYERVGFQVVGEEHTGPFRWLFGFKKADKMVYFFGD